jgi:23S rRNA (adenine2503-C2)-methyltransferase
MEQTLNLDLMEKLFIKEIKMFKEIKSKSFANGTVYALQTEDGYPIEVTDTFLPTYTKDAIGRKQNKLDNYELGSRKDRWMIGVSCMSGCPCHCLFCSTGSLKRWRNLTAEEIVEQVEFVLSKHPEIKFGESYENKINYTRMGECFLNIDNIRKAIEIIDSKYPNVHHFISTIGVQGSDFSWIKDNITLQVSLHSLDEKHRKELIPFPKLMSIEELGKVRTNSNLKTTVNMTLVDEKDFDINKLTKWFDKDYFFIKLSPINKNTISEKNNLGDGIIEGINLV